MYLNILFSLIEVLFGRLFLLIFGGARYICSVLNKEAQQHSTRVVSHRVGPPFKNCPHVAMVNGPDSKTLQEIISGRHPETRKTIDVFGRMFKLKDNLTSATFIIDVPNGLKKREKFKHFIHGSDRLKNIYDKSLEVFGEALSGWNVNRSIHEYFSLLVFRIIGSKVLGLENIPEDAYQMFEEIEDRIVFQAEPLFWNIPLTFSQFRWVLTQRKYEKFQRNIIAENHNSILKGNNYIWVLMEEMASLQGGKPEDYINHKAVAAGVSIFLAMGNLIALLAFSIYVLLEEKEVSKLLFERIRTSDDILKDNYVHRVYLELVRSISPANLMSRYTACGMNIGDKKIPPKSYLMICLKSILHDPEKWQHPEVFDPERKFPPINIYPFIPFSTGERMCPGIQVTEVIFKAFLSLLEDYEFVPEKSLTLKDIPMDDPVIRLAPEYRGHFKPRT